MTDEDRELISELRRLASAGLHLHAADRLERLSRDRTALLEAIKSVGDEWRRTGFVNGTTIYKLDEMVRAAEAAQ